MGITSAMYSGVSGINTNSQAMTVIGNNLANTNTIGFKGSRTVFSDLMSSTVFGSGGSSQVGRGVGVSKIDNIFSQGTFESTSTNTDLAIEGDSFFMLKEVGNSNTFYSRAGAFRFNQEGYLVNPEGFRVQGQAFDPTTGKIIPGDPRDIFVASSGLIPAKATDTLTLNSNLDSSTVAINPLLLFNPADPSTYNYAASTQTYDTLGNPHLVTTYFRKDDTIPNTWNWYWSAEDSLGVPLGNVVGDAPAGTIKFTETGLLDTTDPLYDGTGTIIAADLDWKNGSTPTGITLNFDTTQFNNASRVISQNQNGYASGDLTNVSINASGVVVASYSNGQQINVSAITLAKFANPGGLNLVGSNMFTASDISGTPRVGLPGPELGSIFTNSLEQSNVDMGLEFVNMITVQRGFQANSKIITTVDELLGELINLKR